MAGAQALRPIRVLVVDDSLVMRETLQHLFQRDGMEVVGQAAGGAEAIHLAARLRPDVITMDYTMPDMDGIEATRRIMNEAPTPIVMLSSVMHPDDAASMFRALDAGALTILEKPTLGSHAGEMSIQLDSPAIAHVVETVRLMSEVKVVRRSKVGNAAHATKHATKHAGFAGQKPPDCSQMTAPFAISHSVSSPLLVHPAAMPQGRYKVVCIAASTGGPQALEYLLSQLPARFPVPILVVQHIAKGFLSGLIDWLDRNAAMPVRIAAMGAPLSPGVMHFAPEARHCKLTRDLVPVADDAPPIESVKPSATALFASCAQSLGPAAIGVVLTGMGRDGAAGLKQMRDAGAMTIVQDKDSSAVFGMPAQAVQLEAARMVLPLCDIPSCLHRLVLQGDQRTVSPE